MPFPSPRRRLLIVDDEPGIVERVRTHFAARYEVDTATSPTSAIERFETQRPDVVYAFHPPQAVLAALLLPRAQKTRLVFGVRAAAMEVARYDRLSALTYALELRLSQHDAAVDRVGVLPDLDRVVAGVTSNDRHGVLDRLIRVVVGDDRDARSGRHRFSSAQ